MSRSFYEILQFLEQAEAYGTGIQSSISHFDVLTEGAISEYDEHASEAGFTVE